jgi:hypothetical protein
MATNEYINQHLILWIAIVIWIAGVVAIRGFFRCKTISTNTYNRWNLILQVVTIMIGGVIFWQIAQNVEEIQDQKYATANGWMLDLGKTYLDNSNFRPYFYEGQDIPTNKEDYYKVMAMSEYTLDTFDSFISVRFHGKDEPVERGWKNWMEFCFSNSPALRFYITNNADWYNTNCELWDKVWTNWNYHYTNAPAKNNLP